jgi:hypothetical protein
MFPLLYFQSLIKWGATAFNYGTVEEASGLIAGLLDARLDFAIYNWPASRSSTNRRGAARS